MLRRSIVIAQSATKALGAMRLERVPESQIITIVNLIGARQKPGSFLERFHTDQDVRTQPVYQISGIGNVTSHVTGKKIARPVVLTAPKQI